MVGVPILFIFVLAVAFHWEAVLPKGSTNAFGGVPSLSSQIGRHGKHAPWSKPANLERREKKIKGWVWIHFGLPDVQVQVQKMVEEIENNPDFCDGIILVGPVSIEMDPQTNEPYMIANETSIEILRPIIDAAQERQISVAAMTGPIPALWTSKATPGGHHNRSWYSVDPRVDGFNLDRLVDTSAALALKHGWTTGGYNIDDEAGGSMRTTALDYELWFEFMRVWTDGLHRANVTVTADIGPQWAYDDPAMAAHFHASPIDQFAVMSTYFGDAGNFRLTLGYFLSIIPRHKLAVGLFPAGNPGSLPQTEAKLRAIQAAGISEVWMFEWPKGYKTAPDWGYLFKQWKHGHVPPPPSTVSPFSSLPPRSMQVLAGPGAGVDSNVPVRAPSARLQPGTP